MTDVDHGVRFDLNSIGGPDSVSWTNSTSTAAWLVLDRNRDGYINNGKELFGDYTFQSEPPSAVERNGFRALAEWDKRENAATATQRSLKVMTCFVNSDFGGTLTRTVFPTQESCAGYGSTASRLYRSITANHVAAIIWQ